MEPSQREAKIIPFPGVEKVTVDPRHPSQLGKRKICSECENGYLGSAGVFCREYREEIWDETVAEDCEAYDPLPWAIVCETNTETIIQS